MPEPDRPKLRPYLAAAPEDAEGLHYIVWDQLRLSDKQIRLTGLELELIQLFDGMRTLRDVQTLAMRRTGGQLVPVEVFARLAEVLDQCLFLEGPRFREAAQAPVRQPSCIGCYDGDPESLRRQFHGLFTADGAAGLPGPSRPDPALRAVLLPHIDYGRGGRTYTFAFKELVERTPAALFVIIGTSHYSRHRFTLTRKHFATPLGVVPTDQTYVDRLVQHYGDGLFDDELAAHLPEHSIELEVVLLQYLFEGRRDLRIVPLVVGSFQDCVSTGERPSEVEDIGRMIAALRAVERETPEPICYLISGDLAHIGPKFGDPRGSLTDDFLGHCRRQDEATLERAAAADADGYFQVIAAEDDARRICGLPPTYLVLQAAQPTAGRVVHYDQYVHPRGHESVSFAGMVFER
jgi:AmmeMemoRadiSam system protein B